ncbi:MAG: universal stress protein [Litoreibacter sp.]|nr:universal stress protein [Litoreibacter sp.]
MIKKILVPVRGDGKGDNVLAHASVLAHRFNALIEVTHCRARPEDLMPFGVPIPEMLRKQIVDQSYEIANIEEDTIKEQLHVLAEKLDLDQTGTKIGSAASVSYVEEVGRQVDVIRRHGRLNDVIAVARPDRDTKLGANTLKAALFHSGRPVLMCPPVDKTPETIGNRVVIAWNGSSEAARGLAQGMEIIREATEVSVLTSGLDSGPGTTIDDVLSYLALHNVDAKAVKFSAGRNAGAAILAMCAELGADLMIMGAYGDSYERETLFGGNTQTIVDRANLPVLLSH